MNDRRECELIAGAACLPTVLLRHELPDGTHHLDWMLAIDDGLESPLMTFRADRRIDALAAGERLELARIGDHRRVYLQYEGPISGGRGEVSRVRSGRIESIEHLATHTWRMVLRWDDAGDGMLWQPLELRRHLAQVWLVQCLHVCR